MNQHYVFILGIVAVTLAPTVVSADLPADDFNDNTQGAMWLLYENDANNCRLDETNQRLELRATEYADDLIAQLERHGQLGLCMGQKLVAHKARFL